MTAAATPAGEAARSSRGWGLVLALGATSCWSLAGILIRLVEEARYSTPGSSARCSVWRR